MKILLIGEYSKVHATLAEGLRERGHQVVVASDGDHWKNYPRDIDLKRSNGAWDTASFAFRLVAALPKMRGYDIVQLINPMFLELTAARIRPIYHYLRKHNRAIVLGAFGMDYYWVNECDTRRQLRYSDFNIGDTLRMDDDAQKERKDWIGTEKETLNKLIASQCDAIVAGLYEYWTCYQPIFPEKTTFIPYPINVAQLQNHQEDEPKTHSQDKRIKLFIGINKQRSAYKGTDIMLRAAQRIATRYPDDIELRVAENIPYDEYQKLMDSSDVILDQLYSYTPAMNALTAMAKGLVCVGGGEPENYDIINEQQLRPIINVLPDEESVYSQLQWLINNREQLPRLKAESIEYISRHHDHSIVAQAYEQLYRQILGKHKKT